MNRLIKILTIFLCFFAIIFSFGCYNPNDVFYKVSITYMADNSQVRTLVFNVEKDTYIVTSPRYWGDGSWVEGGTGDFGYIDELNVYHYFGRFNGMYKFKSMLSDSLWDTTMPVSSDMYLQPVYMDSNSKDIVYYSATVNYKKSTATKVAGEKTVYKVQEFARVFDFPIRNGKARLDVSSIIDTLTSQSTENYIPLDEDIGYGYIDYNDHAKRYCYYPSSNPTLVDEDGNIYDNFTDLMDNVTLYLNYDSNSGFAPVEDFVGFRKDSAERKTFALDMVYIPGTKDENGIEHPWPKPSLVDGGAILLPYPSNNDFTTVVLDSPTYNAPINNLLVSDKFLTQELIYDLIQDSSLFGYVDEEYEEVTPMFLFEKGGSANSTTGEYEKMPFSTNPSCGLENYTKEEAPRVWACGKLTDYMIMANMMTYLYNQHNSGRGSTPLSYVYYTISHKVATNAAELRKNGFEIDENATGYRLLTNSEWEYISRIVLDERQLPTFDDFSPMSKVSKSLYHLKSDVNNYRYSFIKSDENIYAVNINKTKQSYSGSGAGLAVARINPVTGILEYDKQTLRYTHLAVGCASDMSDLSSRRTTKLKRNTYGDFDYNIRNAAGIWNLSGDHYCLTSTVKPDGTNFIARGGYFGLTMTNIYALRLYYVTSQAVGTNSLGSGALFCRTVRK